MAGIYIPGMEMPTSCGDCRFCSGQANTDYGVCAWCDVDGKARDAYTRQDCPLIPVPPHGDLIDASTKITVQTYDDMDDEYYEEECTIADALDHWSYEGCPKVIIPAEEGE